MGNSEANGFLDMHGAFAWNLCAAGRTCKAKWLRILCASYIELIRNTPFIVQLFFVFFGLPALGLRLSAWEAGALAMVLN
ncbi:amino acid ABC transporter [Vibrio ishigakensis]|uniref:Amino acid ABC transporter n=1 Tax=Vibrio ishigakensis TaxID=1481914 RepID=A0A0B8PMG4_9VIBR|nr:amino acid ABC transporter, permease protein [Vibrio ishigakensis]GAM64333.1 amino acid ABC transporter [Vibrio ishigakensis]